MNKEKIENHLNHLEKIHRELDQKIKIEYIRYGDDSLVKTMKKQKLHIKEEIEKFKKQIETI